MSRYPVGQYDVSVPRGMFRGKRGKCAEVLRPVVEVRRESARAWELREFLLNLSIARYAERARPGSTLAASEARWYPTKNGNAYGYRKRLCRGSPKGQRKSEATTQRKSETPTETNTKIRYAYRNENENRSDTPA